MYRHIRSAAGRTGQDAIYTKLRKQFFTRTENRFCQAKLPGCMLQATDVHHKRGRGKYYLAVDTWMAVCRHCHKWIDEHTRQAMTMGLIESRLHHSVCDYSTSTNGGIVDFDTS